jgi:glycosyltransferase involved in cell wall biosynthesis
MITAARVLHVTTYNEDCGIGKYQEQFLHAMKPIDSVENAIFPYSPNRIRGMGKSDFSEMLSVFKRMVVDYDIVHVQHELSFYETGQLDQLTKAAQQKGKLVLVTVHTAPSAAYVHPKRSGLSPRSILDYLRKRRAASAYIRKIVEPLRLCDHIFVHNQATLEDLVRFGVRREKIMHITHPIPNQKNHAGSGAIREALDYKEGDTLYATVGFISESKGISHAVKALKFLPDSYKLAIIGGVHPKGDPSYVNHLCDEIVTLGLENRVHITGYIEDDERLHASVGECDICVYPYDPRYYTYVSSGAASIALAQAKPLVVYPIGSFAEMNSERHVCAITQSSTYIELARVLQTADRQKLSIAAKQYAVAHSYEVEAGNLVGLYHKLLSSN